MVKVLVLFAMLFALSPTALAAEPAPEMHSAARIPWAMRCAGPMPTLMIVSLAVLAVLIVISVLYYRKGGGANEE